VHFAVWAPGARSVELIGPWNRWRGGTDRLARISGDSGIWTGFVPGLAAGTPYKFRIVASDGVELDKADPYAFFSEVAPRTASRVWDPTYAWGDDRWMAERGERQSAGAPISIYEVHLGSWRRRGGRFLSYREIAPLLAAHAATAASRTSSSCRSPSTRSMDRGATRRRATSRRPRGTASPRI
jgi:1,4-alpha-glucan branching enzyme